VVAAVRAGYASFDPGREGQEERMGIEEDFTPAGAMMLQVSSRRLRKEGHVEAPDADGPALVFFEDEVFTADDADEVSDALHRLAVNARSLNRGRFS
jgi:hypothetical protein